MPTQYSRVNETRILILFKEKIDQEEGVVIFERPDPPDALIHTRNNQILWIELTSVLRSDELAKNLNKHGLFDESTLVPSPVISKKLTSNISFCDNIIDIIKKSVAGKDAKKNYMKFENIYDRGILILYIDDPLLSSEDLYYILNKNNFLTIKPKKFNDVYLYIRPTYSGSESDLNYIDGFHRIFYSE